MIVLKIGYIVEEQDDLEAIARNTRIMRIMDCGNVVFCGLDLFN